jgi:hypothetical protein
MIRLLSDMPPGVLGLEAVDDVEKEDYENVIAPAIETAIAEHGKVVTDARWAGPAMKVFSMLWPGRARAFTLAELDAAKRWAAG